MATAESVSEYLAERAAPYGGTVGDMLTKTPMSLWDNPDELMEFWSDRDLSHVFPQSTHPHLADVWSNIVAEDASVNRARGAEIMTDYEVEQALLDNEVDAQMIDVFIAGDDPEVLLEMLELAAA